MSKRQIANAWAQLFIKTLKISPRYYANVARIFAEHLATRCGWKTQVETLMKSTMEELQPFMDKFEDELNKHVNPFQSNPPNYQPSYNMFSERERKAAAEARMKSIDDCFARLNNNLKAHTDKFNKELSKTIRDYNFYAIDKETN